jgi:AraC-like DNA-binding protein
MHTVVFAEKLGYPRQPFGELFKARGGVSAPVYFQRLRMEKAQELFTGGQRTIRAVAGRVGFCDAGNFTRVFRLYFRLSPRQFIAQLRYEVAWRRSGVTRPE